ncbi:MAG TPA: trypco2 family protein [Steroidobacteraceae bacterium]|nr:trypco2 family protein [Steroidobacteraceae bacterium]
MNVGNTGAPVTELVTTIKDAIKLANISSTDTERDLRVASIELTLHTVAVAGAGGGIDFRVPFLGMKLRVGGSVARNDTHTVTITLEAPKPDRTYEVRDTPIEEVLVDAIETIRSVISQAAQGDDPFLLNNGVVDLSFAVTRQGTITFGFDGEFKGEVTHKLRMSLEAA